MKDKIDRSQQYQKNVSLFLGHGEKTKPQGSLTHRVAVEQCCSCQDPRIMQEAYS